MKIVICEDDINQMNINERYINNYFINNNIDIPEIKTYLNGNQMLLEEDDIDIAFIDIELNEDINGLDICNVIKGKNPNCIVIVITSYEEYLDDALRNNVFRFLSKPLSEKRLFRNMDDVIEKYRMNNEKILIETNNMNYTLYENEIMFIEARGKHTQVFLKNGEIIISINNFKYFINNLDNRIFYQTHRSYLVNMNHIKNFNCEEITMLHNTQIKPIITRRKYKDFKRHFTLFIGGKI